MRHLEHEDSGGISTLDINNHPSFQERKASGVVCHPDLPSVHDGSVQHLIEWHRVQIDTAGNDSRLLNPE